MAQESKAVDLGKLQDNAKSAAKVYEAHMNLYVAQKRKAEGAFAVAEVTRLKCEKYKSELDKAKQAVLDGARSVAQG
jgi:hypothetical protein